MEKVTPENLLDKLRLHPPEQTSTVCMIARQEIERLRMERDAMLDGIKHAIGCLMQIREHYPEDRELSEVQHHLMGTITDKNGVAMEGVCDGC